VNAYERLLAEAIPTRPAPADPRPAWTPEQQAAHVAALLEALDDWTYHRDRRPHLHLVDQPEAA
jgi:hypothetical protein